MDKVLRHGASSALRTTPRWSTVTAPITAIEDSAAPIRDSSGNVIGAVWFSTTLRRGACRNALNESELRFRTIFNQAAVGIAVTDLDGRFPASQSKISPIFSVIRPPNSAAYISADDASR